MSKQSFWHSLLQKVFLTLPGSCSKVCQNSHFDTGYWKKKFWHIFKVGRSCALFFYKNCAEEAVSSCTKKWTNLCQKISKDVSSSKLCRGVPTNVQNCGSKIFKTVPSSVKLCQVNAQNSTNYTKLCQSVVNAQNCVKHTIKLNDRKN